MGSCTQLAGTGARPVSYSSTLYLSDSMELGDEGPGRVSSPAPTSRDSRLGSRKHKRRSRLETASSCAPGTW